MDTQSTKKTSRYALFKKHSDEVQNVPNGKIRKVIQGEEWLKLGQWKPRCVVENTNQFKVTEFSNHNFQ